MPRRAAPWYRQGRSMWYVTHESKQTPLGVTDPGDRAGAEAAHQRLIDQLAAEVARRLAAPPTPLPSPAAGLTVADAIVGFMASAEKKVGRGKMKAKTAADYRFALAAFGAAFGPRPGAGLLADDGCEEIETWADRDGWSPSTQNTYLGTVQTVFKWCGLRLKVRRPPKESRGADTCLTDDQFALVIRETCRYAGAKGDLRQLLLALRETGARPGELARLEVAGVDWANGCTRLKEHKTRRHTGADRVIHFNTAALAVLTAQRLRYGDGLLFRTRTGGAYRAAAIVRRMGQVSRRVGFRVIAYGLGRHSFATRALSAGVSDVLVAELLGHKGTAMLHRHYSHLGEQARALKDAAERVTSRPAPPERAAG